MYFLPTHRDVSRLMGTYIIGIPEGSIAARDLTYLDKSTVNKNLEKIKNLADIAS